MKKLLLFFSTLFCVMYTYAGNSSDSLKVKYYKVNVHPRDLARGVTVTIDCGHEYALNRGNKRLRDDDNRRMIFNSEVQVLNFFAENGWQLHMYQEYLFKNSNNTSYIFKKQVQPGEKCIIPGCGKSMDLTSGFN